MDPRDYLRSALLAQSGFTHAFFTRRGGVSRGPFESLNLSLEVGDDPEHVRANLERAASALGLGAKALCVPRQVHGSEVLVLGPDSGAESASASVADACVSREPHLACAVRTADCVPVLLADERRGTVAAVHAGWRGVVAGVVPRALERMRSLGSEPSHLLAAIGPFISTRAFEVGPDVAVELRAASLDTAAVWQPEDAPGGKPHADLGRIVRAQLEHAGLLDERIESVPGCTYTDATLFFSHRRDGKNTGRSLSAIVARQAAS